MNSINIFEHFKVGLVDTRECSYRELLNTVMDSYIEDAADELFPDSALLQTQMGEIKIEGCKPPAFLIATLFNPKFAGKFALLTSGEWVKVKSKTTETSDVTWNGDDGYFKDVETSYFLQEKTSVKHDFIEEMLSQDLYTEEQVEALAVSIVNDIQDIN